MFLEQQDRIECESWRRSCFYYVLFPCIIRIQKKRKDIYPPQNDLQDIMIKKKRITIYFKAFGHPHPFLNIRFKETVRPPLFLGKKKKHLSMFFIKKYQVILSNKDLLKEENFTQWVYDKNYHKSDWFYKS